MTFYIKKNIINPSIKTDSLVKFNSKREFL